MPELEIRNLHARVGEKEILRGLDLVVDMGEIHALMGPNGSGKSTLANVIMGHPNLDVTEGQILFKGETSPRPSPMSARGWVCSWHFSIRSRSRA
jgi:Fe-S cluster assembly ATP-binding protein